MAVLTISQMPNCVVTHPCEPSLQAWRVGPDVGLEVGTELDGADVGPGVLGLWVGIIVGAHDRNLVVRGLCRPVHAPPQLDPQFSVRVCVPQTGRQAPYVYAGLCGQQVVWDVACGLVQAPRQLAAQPSLRVCVPQFVLQLPYVYAGLYGEGPVREVGCWL